jgi:UDP-N-acetylmuramoyl-tripeptide--D-alanyl-D-alanine ligase
LRNFYPKELEKLLEGKIITWQEDWPIKVVADDIDDEPIENCLFFLFEKYRNEQDLCIWLKKCGVRGVVVEKSNKLSLDKWIKSGIGIIQVDSLNNAYISIAKEYRKQFKVPFVQVIGSSGKTTTKEMIGSVLNAKYPALIGYSNFNAPAGVAYNLLSMRDMYKAAVLEVGMKGPEIMRYSTSLVKPDIVVVTCIHRSHLVELGSIQNIIKAKAEVLDYIKPEGTLIINGEDENCRRFPLDNFSGQVLKYGFSKEFDIWAEDIEYGNFTTKFKAVGNNFIIPCTINTFAKYNVANALAAVLVGIKLGLSSEEIKRGIQKFETLSGRLKVYKGVHSTSLVDDNFNANPDSTLLFIKEVNNISKNRPVILVMGDMERADEDIKDYAKQVHYRIGEELASVSFEHLVAVGKWAKYYIEGARDKGIDTSKMSYFPSVEEASQSIESRIISGAIVFFKASVYTPVKELRKILQEK